MARSAFESFARLFKGGGVQGRSPCPRSAERGIPLYAHKSAGGGLRGNPRRGFPLFSLRLYVCADTLGGFRYPALRFDPISLVLAQRNGVEPPKKSAFLPRWLHHSRERYCLGRRDVPRPTLWRGWWVSELCACAPFSWSQAAAPYCPFHPISLLLRKETGWSPKETRFWVPPRQLFGPARLSHGLEAPTSQPTASS